MSAQTVTMEVVGKVNDWRFHQARLAVEIVSESRPHIAKDIRALLPMEFVLYAEKRKRELGGKAFMHNSSTLVVVNGKYIGGAQDFVDYLGQRYDYDDVRPPPLYEAMARKGYRAALNATGHPFVYLDVTIGDEPAARMVFELYNDLCPLTCDNFQRLCVGEEEGASEVTGTKLCYKGSLIHRVVPGGWIQGGDLSEGSPGDSGDSVFGGEFEDETFAVEHDRRGILGMANHGTHSNASQFYVSLAPAEWMDRSFVAFGRLVDGDETLVALESVRSLNQRPSVDVVVVDCGLFKV